MKKSEQKGLLDALLIEVQKYLCNLHSDLLLSVNLLKNTYPYTHLSKRKLPVQAKLKRCLALSSDRSLPLVQAILKANLNLRWQQSYTAEDGFDEHYLHNYGWFNIISPDGPFISEDIRISFGYWGQDLQYKEHWHEPEETYFVLAGTALFHSEGLEPRICSADDIVQHESNQRHAIDMSPGPLLAMAIWRGQNLTSKSSLQESV